jgi:hypothetical protein
MTLIGSAVAVAVAAAALWIVTASGAQTNMPADKTTVSGSKMAFSSADNPTATLFDFYMKTSTPEDLVLQLTAECSILTNLKTVGNDTSRAEGTVQIWATIDGRTVSVVPASPGAGGDNGKVTFCNRAYQRTTSGFAGDSSAATIDDYIHTKTANAFNWATTNIGNGPGGNVHHIQVFAALDQSASSTNGTASAEAIIGNRTLVIQPTSYAQTKDTGEVSPTP